ncbi:MAG: DUF357 domain-containing protein [Candidatus Diapherotrites archaeon]|nr:DUF357 domain-containing protein [Candidatus Diapherotrites archaeon]
MGGELAKKVKKYHLLTQAALKKVSIQAAKGTKEFAMAADFVAMAQNYFNDAKHFEEKGDLLNALAAFSYAHAWLDAGVRARVLDGKNDNKLFTLP